MIGEPVPAGYASVEVLEVQALLGESALQLLVVDRDTSGCDATKPGLVTGNGVVSGSMLWEQGQTPADSSTRGWAIVPKSDDYGFFCSVSTS
jgi:hypothetical protein